MTHPSNPGRADRRPLLTQLGTGSPTAGDDCACLVICNAIRWASHGRVGPKSQGEVKEWVRQIRSWARKPTGGLLMFGDCLEVYRHPDLHRAFDRAGAPPFSAGYFQGVSWDGVKGGLYNDRLIHLAIDYHVLRKGAAPMGSTTFNGGHSVALLGAQNSRGRVYTNVADPLFDGRRAGIPDGWQVARLREYRAAAGAWGARPAGEGKATIIAVKRGVK